MSQAKLKIKKGDNVKVLSGKDKGKTGKVLRVFADTRKVVVENVNMHSKFERPRGTKRQAVAQKVSFPGAMAVSKVFLRSSFFATFLIVFKSARLSLSSLDTVDLYSRIK